MIDGVAAGRAVASVVLAINESGTIARLADGWAVLGCRRDPDAEVPEEAEVIRRAAAWIARAKRKVS